MEENEFRDMDFPEEELPPSCMLEEGDLCAHSMDLSQWFSTGLTPTGSFDLGIVAATSFGSLLDALPIPILLIDSGHLVVFLNQACAKITPNYERIHGVPFTTLVPRSRNAEKARWLVRKVFATRKPQVADGILEVEARKIWGRLHFSSIRIGRERFVLLLIEDVTAEKTQLLLSRRDDDQGKKAREELERRVRRLALELTEHKAKVAQDAARRQRTMESLALERSKFETLASSVPFAVTVVGPDAGFRFANQKFSDLFGYESDGLPEVKEWLGELDFLAADGPESVIDTLADWSANESPVGPFRIRRAQDDECPSDITIKALKLEGGAFLIICEPVNCPESPASGA